jgi:DNA topoisomerase I
MPRLRRSSCASPGLTRRRAGGGFVYLDLDGERVDDGTLERIRSLAVPPAWKDVWVCPDANGHLQATGTDAAGRRQYLYHPRWRAHRDRQKFAHVLDFARALPPMRRRVARRLEGDCLTRERVLACAIRLLDRGLFRVGGEEYADENGGYGLATLERAHVRVESGSRLVFDFAGKTGRRHVRTVDDGTAAAVVAALKRRRSGGDELLAYRNGHGWTDIRAPDINEELKLLAGIDCSAKDFRTWHATVLAAVRLAGAQARSRRGAERVISEVVRDVAEHLGNTPAVCRSSYIDPRLFDRFRSGSTISLPGSPGRARATDALQTRIERAVIELLDDYD